jgi:hypothetical protein
MVEPAGALARVVPDLSPLLRRLAAPVLCERASGHGQNNSIGSLWIGQP